MCCIRNIIGFIYGVTHGVSAKTFILVPPIGKKTPLGENKMSDPFYNKTKAPSGKIVSGAAAFMVHTKKAGGPTPMFSEVGAIAAQEMYERMSAAAKRPSLRLVKRTS